MPIITNPYILKNGTTPPVSTYWSQTDKSPNVTVSSDGKVAYKTTGNGHALVRAVQGRSSGKYYVEFFSPVARGTGAGSGDGITAGLVSSAYSLDAAPGAANNGYGIQYRRYQSPGDGVWTYMNGSSHGTSGVDPSPSAGWCGIAIDIDNQRLWWIADGVWAGNKNPRSHPTDPWITFGGFGTVFPAQSCYYGHDTYPTLEGALHVNVEETMVGVEAFQPGGVLAGFKAWDGGDIPAAVPEEFDSLWGNVQALLHFNGPNNSTTFADEVAGNTWTVNGGAKISTAQSLFGGASGDFSGNDGSKYIQLADRPGLRPGTGPYSIEYDWLHQGTPGQWATVFQKGEWNSAGGLTVIVNGGILKVCANGADSGDVYTGMSEGNHYRIEISRDSSGICRVFVNGDLKRAFSQPQNINGTSPIQLMKGGGIVDPARGYLDEFRYTVGAVRHVYPYTPAIAEFPNAARLVDVASLHLHMDGADLSMDSSTRIKFGTVSGTGVATATTDAAFGNQQALFSGGKIEFPSNPDFALPGAFTLSAMLRIPSFSPGSQGLFNIGQYDAGLLWRAKPGLIELFINGSAYSWAHAVDVTARTHAEICRDASGNLYAFLNGTKLAGSAQDTTAIAAAPVLIGRSAHSAGEYLNGNLDEVRLLKGVCLHTSDFTPLTGAYADDAGANTPNKSVWAIDITANNGASYVALQELEMRTAIGGSDVTSPGMAVSSTNSYPGAGAQMLVDNNTTELANAWVSSDTNAMPQRLLFQFSVAQDLKELALLPQAYAGGITRAPKDFSIKYYDKSAGWITVKTFTGITDWAVDVWKTFSLNPDAVLYDALLHFDGDTGGPIKDAAGNAVSVLGSASLTTSQFKFGTASCNFPGDGSGVRVATPAVAAGQDFSAFAFVRLPALTGERAVFTLGVNKLEVYFTSATQMRVWLSDQGVIMDVAVPSTDTGGFHFVTIERKSNSFYLSLNGALVGTYTGAYADVAIPEGTMLGAYNTSAQYSLVGQMDEFGFVAGSAIFGGVAAPVPIAATSNTVRNKWNQTDRAGGLSFSADGLEVRKSEAGNNWAWIRGTARKDTGKWYLEMRPTLLGGGGDVMLGLFPENASGASYPGQSSQGYGYYALNGDTYPTNVTGPALVPNDVLGIAYDADAGKLWFAVNNVWIASGNPAAGTSPTYSSVPAGLFPAAAMYNGPDTQKVVLQPNAATQAYSPPAGFQRWS